MSRPVPQLSRPSALQTGAFVTLVERLHGTLRLNLSFQVGLGRGAQTFQAMLERFCSKWDVYAVEGTKLSWDPSQMVSAENITTASLRLPSEAGHLDTAAFLPAEQARVFESIEARTAPVC